MTREDRYAEWLKAIKDHLAYKDSVMLDIIKEIYEVGYADGCEDTETHLVP